MKNFLFILLSVLAISVSAKDTKQTLVINAGQSVIKDYKSGDGMYVTVENEDSIYKDIYCGLPICEEWEDNFKPFISEEVKIKRVWDRNSKQYEYYLLSFTN